MFVVLLVLFLVVPIAELAIFITVADAIGFLPALGWIVLVSVIGAWLVKREGLQALRRANAKVNVGELPTRELVNGILILLAGALMLTPGFLTDIVGLLFLLPPTRALFAIPLTKRFAAGPILVGSFRARPNGDVVDAESWDVTDSPDRPELP